MLEKARSLIYDADWFEYVNLRERWERELPGQSCADAALDMAILDWVGGKLKTPLYRLLGLNPRKRLSRRFPSGSILRR